MFEENLLSLFQSCPACHEQTNPVVSQILGTYIAVRQKCICGHEKRWDSQPKVGPSPAGNILLSAAVLFSGCSPTKAFRIFSFLNLLVMHIQTYWSYQKDFLWPAIENIWRTTRDIALRSLRENNEGIVVSGDGRADTPGHSAKYGSYSLMDMNSSHIIDIQLVQVLLNKHLNDESFS